MNLPAAGRDAGFVNGLCLSCLETIERITFTGVEACLWFFENRTFIFGLRILIRASPRMDEFLNDLQDLKL